MSSSLYILLFPASPATAGEGALWTIHPFLSCERRTRHKRPYRRCAPLPPSQRGKLIKTLPVVRPVAEHSIPPNARKSALPTCQYIKHTIAVHPACRARALHEFHQPEPIGTTRTRRPHHAKHALQILQNSHDAHLQMTSLRSVPILANPPPPQVAAQATFSFVISIAKGMDELRPCLIATLKNLRHSTSIPSAYRISFTVSMSKPSSMQYCMARSYSCAGEIL